MANTAYLASMALMGVVALGIVALVLNFRPWRQYTPDAAYSAFGKPQSEFDRFVTGTGGSTLLFVVLAVVVTLYLIELIPMLPAAIAIGLCVSAGAYVITRQNGRSNAEAVATASIVLGLLFVLGIVVLLFTG